LKLTLMARSRVSATAMATPRMPPTPRAVETISRLGRASSISVASTPPTRMKGRAASVPEPDPVGDHADDDLAEDAGQRARGPDQPDVVGCPAVAVVRIQLRAEIWMHSAKPIAVGGRLSRAKKALDLFCWNGRIG